MICKHCGHIKMPLGVQIMIFIYWVVGFYTVTALVLYFVFKWVGWL